MLKQHGSINMNWDAISAIAETVGAIGVTNKVKSFHLLSKKFYLIEP